MGGDAMKGKVCLVTGATSGIGREIAAGLARMGATVVLSGRDRAKCESAAWEIGGDASYIVTDLSSQAAVRQLASDFTRDHSALHVLVNNAGVFVAERDTTSDGIERTFAVNHLAPFLLTNLLLDMLKSSALARIVTTSSVAHKGARMNFDDIQLEKSYGGIRAYSQSKLANILFTRELAKRLAGTQVTANCFHPGGVRTGLMRGNPIRYRATWAAAGPFLLSPEKGADTGVYLASSPEVEGVTGKYFVKRKEERPSNAALGEESASRLWKLSEQLTGLA
jgi:NAD(P)-dependent dehydrogenase (short-subunit alcohol dehydrogenase family)